LFVFDDGTDRDVKNLDSGSARTKNWYSTSMLCRMSCCLLVSWINPTIQGQRRDDLGAYYTPISNLTWLALKTELCSPFLCSENLLFRKSSAWYSGGLGCRLSKSATRTALSRCRETSLIVSLFSLHTTNVNVWPLLLP
jgi:hypothetical protein